MDRQVALSIVIPFYNEEKSLLILYDKLIDVLDGLERAFEIVLIDDGSTDGSSHIAHSLEEKDERIKLIQFGFNSGKSKALNAGFQKAGGSIILTMDADLQDDPNEIPAFINKIEEGYDLVSGWKKKRLDPLEKRIPSKIFNYVTALVSGIKLHDFNCGFKAYRRELIEDIKVYGDLHRYIPALAYWKGYRIGEIPVRHRPRAYGKSKYGWKRYFHGFFDLFTVILLTRFIQRPVHIFGMAGIVFIVMGIVVLSFITSLQILYGSILGHKPLSYFGVLIILLGSQLIATGLIAEMLSLFKPPTERLFSIQESFQSREADSNCDLSIITPVFNATGHVSGFLRELEILLPSNGVNCELIIVDDGSEDNAFEVIKNQKIKSLFTLKAIRMRKSSGPSVAVQTGLDIAIGQNVIIVDIEQKNLSAYLTLFIDALRNGNDVAVSWRSDMPFPKSVLSKIFNQFVSYFARIKLHDLDCPILGFKRDFLLGKHHGKSLLSYPIILYKQAHKVREIEVKYSECPIYRTQYRFRRLFKDFLDIFSVILMTDFKSRPLHMFGVIGLVIGSVGFFINLYLTMLKYITGNMGGHYTLLLIGVTLMILGAQWFSTGLLGEVINNIRQFSKSNNP